MPKVCQVYNTYLIKHGDKLGDKLYLFDNQCNFSSVCTVLFCIGMLGNVAITQDLNPVFIANVRV